MRSLSSDARFCVAWAQMEEQEDKRTEEEVEKALKAQEAKSRAEVLEMVTASALCLAVRCRYC